MAFLSLQIKPNDEWLTAVISPDSSVSIEIINSLFDIDAGGGFSYPFTLSVEANQHLFPTLTNNHGAHVYDLIYHKPFRLYAGGVPLFCGIVDMDDEVEIETQDDGTHTVAINLASDNQELSALLEGVNCQDVPVKDKIPVGTEFRGFEGMVYKAINSGGTIATAINRINIPLPPSVFTVNAYSLNEPTTWVNPTNVSEPYPTKPYCNARVCIQKRHKDSDGNYQTLHEYEVFDADRPNTGLCFYVMYFLDCLFGNLDIRYDNSRIQTFDDINRLAFFSTKCEYDVMPTANYFHENNLGSFTGVEMRAELKADSNYTMTLRAQAWTRYANSKNYPDAQAADIINDLQNAFGIRFIFSSFTHSCEAVFIKDIFRTQAPSVVKSAIIHNEEQIDSNIKGVKMTFGVNDDKNTDYNYSPKATNSNVAIKSGYSDIRGKSGTNDKNTYYDSITGNMYRVKVNEDATTMYELNPSLFEVGQFGDASLGDVSDESRTKEIRVTFTPLISNIIEYTATQETEGANAGRGTTTVQPGVSNTTQTSCKYAAFVDVVLDDAEDITINVALDEGALLQSSGLPSGRGGSPNKFYGTAAVTFKARFGFSSSYIKALEDYANYIRGKNGEGDASARSAARTMSGIGYTVSDRKPVFSFEKSPLNEYDAGYTLGIMRGPGNQAGAEILQEDYDGNGNSQWAYTPKDYAFTSDCIDHYGNIFDYNGTAAGGISLDGKTSLKLQAEKKMSESSFIESDSVVVSTREEAAHWLTRLFDYATEDLFSLRIVESSQAAPFGWDVSSFGKYTAILPFVTTVQIDDGTFRHVFINAINKMGNIMSKSAAESYCRKFTEARKGGYYLHDPWGICIDNSISPIPQKTINDLVALVNIYYFPDEAEPYTLTDIPEAALNAQYYPIDSINAHRGLFHKFNYEYAYFLTHARIVRLTVTMSLAELSAVDLTKWYTFGQYTGLIKQISYDIDNEHGLSDVTIELYYL